MCYAIASVDAWCQLHKLQVYLCIQSKVYTKADDYKRVGTTGINNW